MVGTQSWNQPSARTANDPELWHVIVAPGETKVLSLEQLDDLFRLDIIDASTRVWQPGMTEWLPLSVVAGLDDEPARPAPPPPPSSRARPAPPPKPAASTVPVALSAQPIWELPAPAPISAAPLPFAPTVSAPPSMRPVAALPASAPFNAPESLRPLVLGDLEIPRQQPASKGGRFVIALCLLAGLGVTLYRNDVIRQLARSSGQETAYLKLERAIGMPGFGTPRAVEQMTAASLALGSPVETPPSRSFAAEPARAPSPVAASEPAKPEPEKTAAPSAPATPEPSRAESGDKPAAASNTEKPSLENLMAAQLKSGSSKPAAKAAPAPAPVARSRAAAAADSEPKNLGIKGSTNRFDPLNGKL